MILPLGICVDIFRSKQSSGKGRIELYWTWQGPCLMSTRHQTGFGPRRSTLPATPSTSYIFTESSRRHHTNSLPVKSRIFHILLSYDSNTRAYRFFNKSTGLVEVSCDIVFDETNGSQVEQVDLDELDDEEAPCITLRNMSIRDVYPKESEKPTQAQDQP
jgi:hypothetical protein